MMTFVEEYVKSVLEDLRFKLLYREDSQGPTLSLSIGHQKWPCRSHYFVTNGKIVLCSDHGVGKEQKI